MVQSFAEDILQTLQKNLLEQDYSREQLKKANLHESISHFLQNTLDRRLEFEMERMESTWFDFSNPAVKESVGYLRAQLYTTARIPANEWHKTLAHAVRLVAAYLLRPNHTLTGFIFGKENQSLDMTTILRRMQYFSPYPYLVDIFGTYVQHNQIHEMESGRFLDLLTQIDRRYVKDFNSVTDWMELLKPLFEIGEQIYSKGYPIFLFQIFFDDKGELEFKKRLLFEEQIRGIAKISPAELKSFLESVALGTKNYTQPETISHSQNANSSIEAFAVSPSTSPTANLPSSEIVQQLVPRWQAFRSQSQQEPLVLGNTALSLYPSSIPKPNIAKFESKILNLNESLALKTAKPKDTWVTVQGAQKEVVKKTPPPVPTEEKLADKFHRLMTQTTQLEQTIFGGMHPERRTWYLQKLFNNRLVEYNLFLNRLRGIQNWTKAAELIAIEVFMKNKVNIYSEAALSFTDLVESLYLPKS